MSKKQDGKSRQLERGVRRCRKRLNINEDDLMGILSGKFKITNIPENTLMVSAGYDLLSGGWNIIIENEAFELIGDGCQYPIFLAEFQAV